MPISRAFELWTMADRRVELNECALVLANHGFGKTESALHQCMVVAMALQRVPLLRRVRRLFVPGDLPSHERSVAVLEDPKDVTRLYIPMADCNGSSLRLEKAPLQGRRHV